MSMDNSAARQSSSLIHKLQPFARRFGWVTAAAWMLAVFALAYFALPRLENANLSLFLLQPLLYLSLAGLAVFLAAAAGDGLHLAEKRDLIFTAAMLGGIQVAVGVLLGLLLGFGDSPYARQPLLMALNLWFATSRLVGVEVTRGYLVKTVGKPHSGLGFALGWLLPLLVLIPPAKYGGFGAPESAFYLAGQTLLPAAAENLLAASLAATGGPLASFAYRGVMQAFEWLSPILPDLPWMAAAFVGVIVPVFGLLVLHPAEASPNDTREPGQKKEHASLAGWIPVGLAAVVVIWLNTGVLGVQPSLMSGPSMNPTLYAGDVVLTRRLPPELVRAGDIIRFHRDGVDVVHRVKAVQDVGGQLIFTTRGDNNNVDDGPVTAGMYQGKVILTLPKIGWIGILARQAVAWIGGLL